MFIVYVTERLLVAFIICSIHTASVCQRHQDSAKLHHDTSFEFFSLVNSFVMSVNIQRYDKFFRKPEGVL